MSYDATGSICDTGRADGFYMSPCIKMKAIALAQCFSIDEPAALIDIELTLSVLGERDVLARIRAVGLNPMDLKLRPALVKPLLTHACWVLMLTPL